jgi:hypothetical protein
MALESLDLAMNYERKFSLAATSTRKIFVDADAIPLSGFAV